MKSALTSPERKGRIMDLDEYQKQAERTINKHPGSFTKFDNVNDIHMMEAIFGLNGEVGEVTDLWKKYMFQGHPFEAEKFKEELGDMLWYMSLFAKALGIPLSEIAKYNIRKLQLRFPDGFEAEKSIHRSKWHSNPEEEDPVCRLESAILKELT